ncbi:SdpI family protein [Lactobacillus sp. ESL0225]|uniref:SdpI family protein n=1 Tax=Lactobacillus sp. ESL0225 TaxID=2069351 RepID=UPI000EFD88C6|nr:SdpI family protein [Lactobacillus sp. ESL0225]RMC51295.1 SdpI family protein [Lactobacillus sp. ESL0225]
MIYVACGSITLVIGILWLISPAKRPNPFYGYYSYLSRVNKASFRFAQKKASMFFIIFGVAQTMFGLGIHFLNLDRYFFIWLLTFYFFPLFSIILTEKSVKSFLLKRHELPSDYIDPDQVKSKKTKGFKK